MYIQASEFMPLIKVYFHAALWWSLHFSANWFCFFLILIFNYLLLVKYLYHISGCLQCRFQFFCLVCWWFFIIFFHYTIFFLSWNPCNLFHCSLLFPILLKKFIPRPSSSPLLMNIWINNLAIKQKSVFFSWL